MFTINNFFTFSTVFAFTFFVFTLLLLIFYIWWNKGTTASTTADNVLHLLFCISIFGVYYFWFLFSGSFPATCKVWIVDWQEKICLIFEKNTYFQICSNCKICGLNFQENLKISRIAVCCFLEACSITGHNSVVSVVN